MPEFEDFAKEYLKLGEWADDPEVLARSVDALSWFVPNISEIKVDGDKASIDQFIEHVEKKDSTYLPVVEGVAGLGDIPHSPVYVRSRLSHPFWRYDGVEVAVWVYFLETRTKHWAEYASSVPLSNMYIRPEGGLLPEGNKAYDARRLDYFSRMLTFLLQDVRNWAKEYKEGNPLAESRARFLVTPPELKEIV